MIDRRLLIASMLATGAVRPAAPRALRQPDLRLLAAPAGVPVADGFAPGPHGRVFYRRFGGGGATPVIVLHGGPAAAHGYMLPYAHLAADRPTILYDQGGCGRSDAPGPLSRYTLDSYVAELEALRAHLGIERSYLLGHSWGGLLAPAYAAKYPRHVAGLVLAGTARRWRDFQITAERWLAQLGPRAVATVRRAEASGNTDDPAYQALIGRYYQLHLCRLDPWPKLLTDAAEALGRNKLYPYLNGPTEFQFTGAFAGLDMTPALQTVHVPTLVTCGEFDEGPPAVARDIAVHVAHARVLPFAGLSHMSHIEDPARVIGATRRFLASAG